MQPGELLHGPDGHDAWLSVVRGRVWVTQAGDPADHFLDSGQSIRLRAGARALVGAEGAAEVTVANGPTRRGGPAAALWRAGAALRAGIRTLVPASDRLSPGTGDALRGRFVG
jgi:hypothetical protein